MMGVMKPNLALSDSATSVAGCEILLGALIAQAAHSLAVAKARVPSKSSLQKLIITMSETARLGEESSIEIKSKIAYVPWTMAFIK
jgi:hypothetical protein